MWIAGSLPQSEETCAYSLYVHIPFCTRKCPYCHFYVLPYRESDADLLVQALLAEWELRRPSLQGRALASLYFGGGTPALLPAKALERLIQAFSGSKRGPHLEITLEANPEDVSIERLTAWHALGMNRLSFGVQSLQADELVRLGRKHSPQRACRAIEDAHTCGFRNISIDLMMETPLQTLSSWQETLHTAVSLPIQHLSLYNLTIEPHTAFARQGAALRAQLPSQEVGARMLQEAKAVLDSSGWVRYEISAFARSEEHRSCHNQGYWLGRPFWGLGPSAWSFWDRQRIRNLPHLRRWASSILQGDLAEDEHEELSAAARQAEMLAVGLRLVDGLDRVAFETRWGPLPGRLLVLLQQLGQQGLVDFTETRIRLTDRGLDLHDEIASELVLPEEEAPCRLP